MEPLQHGLLQEKDCNPSLIILRSKSLKQATAKQLPLPPEQAALVREATHPVCWDKCHSPTVTPVKHFSTTETKIKTQNEAHSMFQHLLDHLQSSQRISNLQQQPVHHQ